MTVFSFHKIAKAMLCATVCSTLIPALSACEREVDYFDYVSENRSNFFVYSCEDFSVRAQYVVKEYPYVADGYCAESTYRTEFFVSTATNANSCLLTFFQGGEEYGGETSFDSVKREYYYSCTVDTSQSHSIDASLTLDGKSYDVTLRSVRSENTLSPEEILKNLKNTETELFNSLTDGNAFLGEIYLRLLYEDAPYYYAGIVDRNGNITAFLLDAETGKILAKRTS